MVTIRPITINKKTVFKTVASIKREKLTKEGYFDFTYISELRVSNSNFLKSIRNKKGMTQEDLARIVNVSGRILSRWERGLRAMPFISLIKICRTFNISNTELYASLKGSLFTYGTHHGKNKLRLPLKPKEFDIIRYMIPIKPDKTYIIKNIPNKIKRFILNNYSIDKYYFKKKGLIVIYSYLLNKFLNTFYNYKKELLIKYPLTKDVYMWRNKLDLVRAVIIPILLSDGGNFNNKFSCFGASDIIHEIWADAWYYSFNKVPSSFKRVQNNIYNTDYLVNYKLNKKLKQICPNFKTAPRNESVEHYLSLPQPSIEYLLKRPIMEQKTALRLWAITEGSISVHYNKKDGLITPNFRISCAHPTLTEQLKILTKNLGINMSFKKDKKYWADISGLQTTSIKSTINFLRIGGFIRGVKISKSRSKVFGGFDKQDVFLGILEFMIRQRKERENNRFNNIQNINKAIVRIIKNKEFKNEGHYIRLLSKTRI